MFVRIKTSFIFFTLLLTACKKDKGQTCSSSNFDSITRDCIVATESSMQSQAIPGVDVSGTILLQPGTILIYKTTNGRYGKIAVSVDKSNNNKLVLKGVTYNDDGSVYKSILSLAIGTSDFADLDEMVESTTQNVIDFFWNRVNLKIDFVPMVGAKFVKYTF